MRALRAVGGELCEFVGGAFELPVPSGRSRGRASSGAVLTALAASRSARILRADSNFFSAISQRARPYRAAATGGGVIVRAGGGRQSRGHRQCGWRRSCARPNWRRAGFA